MVQRVRTWAGAVLGVLLCSVATAQPSPLYTYRIPDAVVIPNSDFVSPVLLDVQGSALDT